MAEPRQTPLPNPPLVLMLTRVVTPPTRSRTYTSVVSFVSPATRLLARLSKSAYRPLVETSAGQESPLPPPVPPRFTLTRLVVPFVRSRRKTLSLAGNRAGAGAPLVREQRLFALLAKSTYRPSGLNTGVQESPPPLA